MEPTDPYNHARPANGGSSLIQPTLQPDPASASTHPDEQANGVSHADASLQQLSPAQSLPVALEDQASAAAVAPPAAAHITAQQTPQPSITLLADSRAALSVSFAQSPVQRQIQSPRIPLNSRLEYPQLSSPPQQQQHHHAVIPAGFNPWPSPSSSPTTGATATGSRSLSRGTGEAPGMIHSAIGSPNKHPSPTTGSHMSEGFSPRTNPPGHCLTGDAGHYQPGGAAQVLSEAQQLLLQSAEARAAAALGGAQTPATAAAGVNRGSPMVPTSPTYSAAAAGGTATAALGAATPSPAHFNTPGSSAPAVSAGGGAHNPLGRPPVPKTAAAGAAGGGGRGRISGWKHHQQDGTSNTTPLQSAAAAAVAVGGGGTSSSHHKGSKYATTHTPSGPSNGAGLMSHVVMDMGAIPLGGGMQLAIPLRYDDLAKTGAVPRLEDVQLPEELLRAALTTATPAAFAALTAAAERQAAVRGAYRAAAKTFLLGSMRPAKPSTGIMGEVYPPLELNPAAGLRQEGWVRFRGNRAQGAGYWGPAGDWETGEHEGSEEGDEHGAGVSGSSKKRSYQNADGAVAGAKRQALEVGGVEVSDGLLLHQQHHHQQQQQQYLERQASPGVWGELGHVGSGRVAAVAGAADSAAAAADVAKAQKILAAAAAKAELEGGSAADIDLDKVGWGVILGVDLNVLCRPREGVL